MVSISAVNLKQQVLDIFSG